VILVENDRKFDVGKTLRKAKRTLDMRYPIKVIIPKEFKDHAFRFQKSGIPVWYWIAICRWLCRDCNKITKSSSSLTPPRCDHCNKRGFLHWVSPEDVDFEPDEKNSLINYKDRAKMCTPTKSHTARG